MFLSAFRYSYINSKLHSLKSGLLQNEDYKNLLQSQGLDGFIECLKSTQYAKDVIDPIHTYDELMDIYIKNLFNDYTKIIDNLSGNYKNLVNFTY